MASIEALSGKNTAIALDTGFIDAWVSLELTPGVTGDARLTGAGSLVFPITGGNVTAFEPGAFRRTSSASCSTRTPACPSPRAPPR